MRNGYPLRFACEATLNIAKNEKVLELMREAGFITVFCGIETPEPEALHAISKDQNLRMPILEAVQRINSYGIEVVSGIILGLDTDTPTPPTASSSSSASSHIPLLTINILYALPKTPLWRRLETEGRLVSDARPRVQRRLQAALRDGARDVAAVHHRGLQPEALYAAVRLQRGAHVRAAARLSRTTRSARPGRTSHGHSASSARMLWRVGVRGDYRRTFWRLAWPALRRGRSSR